MSMSKETSGLFSGTSGAKSGSGGATSGGSGRTFSSKDPLVGGLANDIEAKYPGKIVGVNKIVKDPSTGKIITDFDIETDKVVVQVKSGKGTGLTKQMDASKSATTKEVVAYGPKLGKHIIKNLKAKGFKVFTKKQELIDYLGGL